VLTLYNGESFENLRRQISGNTSGNIPFRRESFESKQIAITFNANFAKMDESVMQGQYVTKNVAELGVAMDSLISVADSLKLNIRKIVQALQSQSPPASADLQSVPIEQRTDYKSAQANIDTLFLSFPRQDMLNLVNSAIQRSNQARQELQYHQWTYKDTHYLYRRHGIEWHRKFTLAFACLVFFFIGAPLGAIIRKGGLGMPVVVSVFLFIFYYIIDNTGYKFARDGAWTPAEGMWLSAVVLSVFGAFLTYKAVKDAVILDFDGWLQDLKKLFKRKE
ncbi:MAG: LptF/LptG family permease, partial [Prevotellaceae bacterium]|jgi:lipopolysaccharide export system permease protein|nr:LptF/LptG family permease [Prevotellaceae bacterium]